MSLLSEAMITACGRYLELQLGLLPMSAAAAAACIKKKGIGGQSKANSMFETLSAISRHSLRSSEAVPEPGEETLER